MCGISTWFYDRTDNQSAGIMITAAGNRIDNGGGIGKCIPIIIKAYNLCGVNTAGIGTRTNPFIIYIGCIDPGFGSAGDSESWIKN